MRVLLFISPWQLESFKRMLVTEGFRNIGIFQIWKRGQKFGYACRLASDLEWHIRAFADGTIESEVELPRTTIHHLSHHPYSHDGLLADLLTRHRIPFRRP